MSTFVLILCAPSGVGKTTIARALLAARDDLGFSVSATTRPPRKAEANGIDYHFLSREEFQRRIEANEFLEWADYGGELYGTLASEIERLRDSGQHAVLDIEVQGAKAVRERVENVVSIFILPPSAEVLVERLRGRRSESPDRLAVRLQRAIEEITEAPSFDYVLINDDLDQAVKDVACIIDTEARRTPRQRGIEGFLRDLSNGLARAADQVMQG